MFLQGTHTNGQYVNEKTFSVINHQGNANHNPDEMSLDTC